eukprot:402692-Rhodomonas_salina.1
MPRADCRSVPVLLCDGRYWNRVCAMRCPVPEQGMRPVSAMRCPVPEQGVRLTRASVELLVYPGPVQVPVRVPGPRPRASGSVNLTEVAGSLGRTELLLLWHSA